MRAARWLTMATVAIAACLTMSAAVQAQPSDGPRWGGRDGRAGVRDQVPADRQGRDGRDGWQGRDGRDARDARDGWQGRDGRDARDGVRGQARDGGQGRAPQFGQRGQSGPQDRFAQRGEQGRFGQQSAFSRFAQRGQHGQVGQQGRFAQRGPQGRFGQHGRFGRSGQQGHFGPQSRFAPRGQHGQFGQQGRFAPQGRFGQRGQVQPQGQDRLSQFREAIRSRIEQWLNSRTGAAAKPKVAPGPAPKAAAPESEADILSRMRARRTQEGSNRDADIKALNDRLNELNRKLDALLRQQSQPAQPPVRPNVDKKPEAPKAAPPTDGERPRGFGRFGPGMGGRFTGPDGERPARPEAPRDAGRDGESARSRQAGTPELPTVAKIQDLVKAYQDATKDATPQQRRELQRKLLKDIRDLESQQ